GHKCLVETVLKKGKPIVIAIRDTEISHENPYSVSERWAMIHRSLREYGELVKIISIPDIDEICYGRDVGYGIRRIELDKDTEAISGTATREQEPTHDIIWLTGQSGAGKTTLANELEVLLGGVVLDGDEMRESISIGAGFSKDDRDEHNMRVARLAKTLAKRSPVIVSVISPFSETRQKIDELIKPIWIYIERDLPSTKEKPYEPPLKPDMTVTITEESVPRENAEKVVAFLRSRNGT
ncbi:MAG: adenylyl-sulfate kinase, partial [bacterium]|nr:adenylyl-sulfate kinase [bacterium]